MGDSIFQTRRRGRAFWLFLPVLLALYLLLFPRPGGKEAYMRPVWARQISPGSEMHSTGEAPRWYFRAADAFGYADLEGNLYHVGRTLHHLSLSDAGFINYGPVPDHIVFMDARGEFQFSIKSYGYPLLDQSGQLLYSIHTDLGGLKRIDREGEILWSMSFPSPLTTVALVDEECLVGLMDGRALLMGPEGNVVYECRNGGSRIPVTLGAAMSEDRNRLALFSGIDPQRLTVIRRRNGGFETEIELTLSSDFRREVQLHFTRGGRFLFYEARDGLGVLDLRKNSTAEIGAPGMLGSLDSGSEFAAASFREVHGSNLLLFRPQDSVLASRELPLSKVYLKILGNSLILGFEGSLLRADLTEG
jgi:hypothetical protein